MLRFRSTPVPGGEVRKTGSSLEVVPGQVASSSGPSIRRMLSRESGQALEMLGHAIEYLADEYAADVVHAGPLGNADPRVEAIQILKRLNRAVYYSGTEAQPPFRRMRRWLSGASGVGPHSR